MNIIRGQHHYDNHVVDYYYKLRKQPNEKPHKTAIIACINRLLKTIHYLVMNHKLYDYQMSPTLAKRTIKCSLTPYSKKLK